MRHSHAKAVALGGVLAAAAVVVICLGGLIPVATYVCPMICCLLLQIVFRICGRRIAWTWYAAVSILAVLMSPDKEAAAVFLALGYYPIVKPSLDARPAKWILKFLLFNAGIALVYLVILRVMGTDQGVFETEPLGLAGLLVMLLLGNVAFFLLDRVLQMKIIRG